MADKVVLVGGDRNTMPLDLDGTMAGNSDDAIPSQKAVKTYVDSSSASSEVGRVINPDGVVFDPSAVTEDGALPTASFIQLDSELTGLALTVAPTAGRLLVITQADAGTAGHVVTCGPGTFDGTNNTATFNAAGETLVLFGISSTQFVVVANVGSVGLSSVA